MVKFKKKIKPVWGNIHIIQEKLGKKLNKHDKGYVDSVKMVAGELLENSVKYYMNKGINKPIEFCFNNYNGLEISIKNQKIEKEDFEAVTELLDRINDCLNPYDLFIERLQEILDNRVKGESKLGLLRIASDGGYLLDYETNKDTISIYARKRNNGSVVNMKSLIFEDLKIEVAQVDELVRVAWIGKCRTLNPENILDTYLAKLVEFSLGKKIIVTFDKLESMNSSTVPPLLTFIKTLEENKIQGQFLYDDNEDWQRASFKPLSVIAGRYKHIKITPIKNHEFV